MLADNHIAVLSELLNRRNIHGQVGWTVREGNSANNPSQILTLAELAQRLKVSERWVYEKSRRRCLNPLPCIRIGRYLRFDWASVSSWLRQQERGA